MGLNSPGIMPILNTQYVQQMQESPSHSNQDIYDRLRVRKIINAQARSSNSLMRKELLRAMVEAAVSFMEISELLRHASGHIARLIRVEAALIVNSAAPGLTVTTAACSTG
jgi:seryl-tRNA(Sec) selenium transferase